MTVEPATFAVIRHKLAAITEDQAITLKAVSASPIVTEASDFNNGLYMANGDIVTMGPQVVYHAGTIPIVIESVLADWDADEIGEDDMFLVNDPFKGAVHHPDMALVAPIHHEGALIAWAGAAAHQVDVGGMSVGSISVNAREKQQEGLMLPPTKLIEGGRMRADVWRLILNMTRQPEMVGLDLKGFIASNVVAKARLMELISRYGLELVRTVMRELIRYSERRFRQRLGRLPDGEFRSRAFLDHDGHANRVYATDLRLVKDRDVLRFDFSGSSPQAPGFINCTRATLIGAVFGGTAPILGRDMPWNHGILNAVEVIAPEGLICNASPPAPTGSGTIAEGWVVVNTIVHALSKLVAVSAEESPYAQAVTHGTFDALIMGERNQHGEGYGTQLMDAQIGGGGASAQADGIDQSGGYVTPRPNIPNVESNELHGPMLYLYRSFFPDSGGPGRRRGGRAAGLAFTPYGVERLRCTLTTQGVEVPVSSGVFGGWPGVCNRHAVIEGTRVLDALRDGELTIEPASVRGFLEGDAIGGRVRELPAKVAEFKLHAGDVLEYSWSGGGGYGDPLDREPALVRRDVEDASLTRSHAERAYGVVIDDDVRVTETARCRDELRRRRLGGEPSGGDGLSGELVAPLGPALMITREGDRLRLSCRCGRSYCDAAENWKLFAVARPVERPEWPPGIRIHDDLELVQYLCPACGVLQAVEVEDRGAGPVQDFRLVGWT